MASNSAAPVPTLLLGEFRRTLDERYRVSIPLELASLLTSEGSQCVLAKQRPGALSLWQRDPWEQQMSQGLDWVTSKMAAGKLEGQVDDLQQLGRLLSSRHCHLQLMGRGRLVIPEGFREFLGVAGGEAVMVVGAAVCVEIWHPQAWLDYLRAEMPQFRQLFGQLAN